MNSLFADRDTVFLSWGGSGSSSHKLAEYTEKFITNTFQNSLRVFLSSNYHRSIHPGERWKPKINENIQRAAVCFAFYTRSNLNNEWMLWETAGIAGGGGTIVPVRLYIPVNQLPQPLQEMQAPLAAEYFDALYHSCFAMMQERGSSPEILAEYKERFKFTQEATKGEFDKILKLALTEEPGSRIELITSFQDLSLFDGFEGEYYAVNAPLRWEKFNMAQGSVKVHQNRLESSKLKEVFYVYPVVWTLSPDERKRFFSNIAEFFERVDKKLSGDARRKIRFFIESPSTLHKHQRVDHRWTFFVGKKNGKIRAIFYLQNQIFQDLDLPKTLVLIRHSDTVGKFRTFAQHLKSEGVCSLNLKNFIAFAKDPDAHRNSLP